MILMVDRELEFMEVGGGAVLERGQAMSERRDYISCAGTLLEFTGRVEKILVEVEATVV